MNNLLEVISIRDTNVYSFNLMEIDPCGPEVLADIQEAEKDNFEADKLCREHFNQNPGKLQNAEDYINFGIKEGVYDAEQFERWSDSQLIEFAEKEMDRADYYADEEVDKR